MTTFSVRPFRVGRRALLRGAGASIALPWLEAMTPPRARAAGAPRRLIVFFTPNGTIRDQWIPTGGEADFALPRILKPLEPFRRDLVVLEGIDNVAASAPGPGDPHMRGMGCMLTGGDILPGTTVGGAGAPAGLAGGISVDQEIVANTRPNTRFPSLELGVQSARSGTVWGYTSYRGGGQALPPENNPAELWQRIFSEVGANPGDDVAFERARAQRRSVLSGVMANYRLWMQRLGARDRQRLDQHLTNVQELEGRLLAAGAAPVSASCKRPVDPSKLSYASNDHFPEVLRLQMDLLTMSLECDLTRIATLQCANSVGVTRFTWLGISRTHHDLSHDPDSSAESQEMLTRINEWLSGQLAYLLGKLQGTAEGGGTLLDNSLVLWCNELGKGNTHSRNDVPFVLAGRAGGALRTGRFLRYGEANPPHNNLLVSILNLFGVGATTFGNPDWCTGPLAGLV